MAVLYRINARSEPFEEAFAAAGIPYQVRDGAFLRRPGPARCCAAERADRRASWPRRQRRHRRARVRSRGRARRRRGGHAPGGPGPAARAGRGVRRRRTTTATWRRSSTSSASGSPPSTAAAACNLLTYHRAKGLEFDAVFLPRLLDGELPFRSRPREGRPGRGAPTALRRHHAGARVPVPHLADGRQHEPSPFLDELGVRTPSRSAARPSSARIAPAEGGGPRVGPVEGVAEVARPSGRRARVRGVPRPDARRDRGALPKDWADLAAISGVGPTKLERYGDEVLAVVATV